MVDPAVHWENGGGRKARGPAALRVRLRPWDALPGARLLLFAPNQEQDQEENREHRGQVDPDQDDRDQRQGMDDPVDRSVPLAAAIRAAARLGLCLPARATAG